ncbi:MAG: hypothetical protein OEY20_06240 [Gemmatimonadota bacterium]|nr:hypothetical protein [Gemmatimonadota bacterium]MDH4350467.1 hypothetical protein [Gemmatimonadota bacterium]MDH5196832.1 hypothetical protein [Gemmatimonadota bacterium]
MTTNPLPKTIDLGAEDEARRLWHAAQDAKTRAGADLVALIEALDLGLHAAEILVIQRLQPVKDRFPATIGAQLATPTPEVDPHRDGIHVPKVLQFTDVIDLLSGDELECVSPGMHRGWEDRAFACRRSRAVARETIGITLTAAEQTQLLLLAAYRNRLFRCPPPVRVIPADIHAALDPLARLVERLLQPS